MRALLFYTFGWLAAGVAVAGVALMLLGGGEDDVALPPVHGTRLSAAAAEAGCLFRAGDARDPAAPTGGPPAAPAAPGVYDDAPAPAALVGALRRGVIVIHHRPELPDEAVAALRMVHAVMPDGTIVAPNAEMRFLVAVTAWRRVLGCRGVSDRTLDAVRLFHGRFVGSGPDSTG